jgi:hypothetical protein
MKEPTMSEAGLRSPEARGFPWPRVLAGLALVATAAAIVLWLRQPADLKCDARFEPATLVPGGRGRLLLRVSPGPGASGEMLQNVRAEVTAPRELVFDRNAEYLLPGEEEMVLGFSVDRRAAPGPRRLSIVVVAELPAGARRSVARTAELRRELEVVIAPPPVNDGKN